MRSFIGNEKLKVKSLTTFYLWIFWLSMLCIVSGVLSGCSSPTKDTDSSQKEAVNPTLSGGSSTVFDASKNAFGHPSPSLSGDELTQFFAGQSFFDSPWVMTGSSAEGRDGLGPFFNANNCSACHSRDGRGRPPIAPGESFTSLLLRLSVPGETFTGEPKGDPHYGGQLQGEAVFLVAKEGTPVVTYTEIPGSFPDGETYSLSVPTYRIDDLAYGPLDSGVMISPRVAPAMIGMGLLEDIPESAILALADEMDADGDGISGKPNWVWDELKQGVSLGRFGWKANQPSVLQQTAGAFLGDIGITSPLFPNQNITDAQREATQDLLFEDEFEIPQDRLDQVVVYSQNLAVPARRNVDDPVTLRGEILFDAINCSACHRPTMPSRGEIIRPYTDMLLHDMGPGLADGRPDFEASGSEWRTPPLWGIGLVEVVNGHTRFLHDGRARNLQEAILWHGGEAEASKEAFKALPKSDRDALIAFLKSL